MSSREWAAGSSGSAARAAGGAPRGPGWRRAGRMCDAIFELPQLFFPALNFRESISLTKIDQWCIFALEVHGLAVRAVNSRDSIRRRRAESAFSADSARRANLAIRRRRAESAFSADSARRANLAIRRRSGRGRPFF